MTKALLAMLLFLASNCRAGESRWTKIYRYSVAAVVAGSVADMTTSMGKYEANPILRGANGTFGGRGIALKSAQVGGSLAIGWLLARHHHPGIAAVANIGMAGTFGITAAQNTKISKALK